MRERQEHQTPALADDRLPDRGTQKKRPGFTGFAAGIVVMGVATVTLLSGSCADDAKERDADTEAEVRLQLDEWLEAQQSADADKFLAHVTQDWLETVTDATEHEVRARPSDFLGGAFFTIKSVRVSGKTATAQIDIGPQGNLSYTQTIEVIKEGNNWKVDRLFVASADRVPADAKKVDVELDEWSFRFDEHRMTGDSQLVLRVKNSGDEPHMLVLARIPRDANLRQLLELEEPSRQYQEGREELGAAVFFGRGDPVAEVVITERLAPGRYAFLCFVTSPGESVQHVSKEMFAEFTVQ